MFLTLDDENKKYFGCRASTVVGHIFLVLTPKTAFAEDFSDILTNNKFNKIFWAITPTPYLNFLFPKYLITLINTL